MFFESFSNSATSFLLGFLTGYISTLMVKKSVYKQLKIYSKNPSSSDFNRSILKSTILKFIILMPLLGAFMLIIGASPSMVCLGVVSATLFFMIKTLNR